MLTQELLIVVRAVLSAPVRMLDAAFWRLAQGDRHLLPGSGLHRKP